MGTGTAPQGGARGTVSPGGMASMPGGAGRGASPGMGMPGAGFSSFPGSNGNKGTAINLLIAAAVFAGAGAYWHVEIGAARTQAAVVRAWAQSPAVKAAIRGAVQTAPAKRKATYAANKNKVLAAYKTVAQKTPGGASLAAQPVPLAITDPLETALIKRPNQATQSLMNTATRIEAAALPFFPVLVTNGEYFQYTEYALIGGFVILAGLGGFLMVPKRHAPFNPMAGAPSAATPKPAPVSVPTAPMPVASASPAPAMPISTPRSGPPTITPPTLSTPFPPPPDATTPTIPGPARGSIAANVAAVGSASAEVARLVRRLEELETLSEKMRDERDETRKELTWTQGALDDFKKRVSDATTMAAASAAQSAGASEQRAAQAEAKVTEAVEHINEALQRAMGAEQSVMQAKERAQTADERAKHAEVRSQEMQYQLSRAMERLADLERLAATTRMGGLPASPVSAGPIVPPALPSPDATRHSHPAAQTSSVVSPAGASNPMDAMLAAAARPAPAPAPAVHVPEAVAVPQAPEPVEEKAEVPATAKRIPPPRLTPTKMSDIQAGLKLASSIRSRTQKAAAGTEE